MTPDEMRWAAEHLQKAEWRQRDLSVRRELKHLAAALRAEADEKERQDTKVKQDKG